jgi:hypothetical protein
MPTSPENLSGLVHGDDLLSIAGWHHDFQSPGNNPEDGKIIVAQLDQHFSGLGLAFLSAGRGASNVDCIESGENMLNPLEPG